MPTEVIEYVLPTIEYVLPTGVIEYVLNRRSRKLHKLPASESCNTDQIASEDRFYLAAGEDVVAYVGLGRVRRCLRCFRGELPQDG